VGSWAAISASPARIAFSQHAQDEAIMKDRSISEVRNDLRPVDLPAVSTIRDATDEEMSATVALLGTRPVSGS
jgi:hypothetical protein